MRYMCQVASALPVFSRGYHLLHRANPVRAGGHGQVDQLGLMLEEVDEVERDGRHPNQRDRTTCQNPGDLTI